MEKSPVRIGESVTRTVEIERYRDADTYSLYLSISAAFDLYFVQVVYLPVLIEMTLNHVSLR